MAKGITERLLPARGHGRRATRSSPPSPPTRPTPAGCATSTRSAAIPPAARSRSRRSRSWRRRACSSARRRVGADLLARLRDALGDHPLVGDVRGRGLLIGIELVADQATRAPAERAVTAGILAAAQQRGLLVGRNVDTAAGLDNVIALAPPAVADRRGRSTTSSTCWARCSRSTRARRLTSMKVFAGGTVVTAEGSFRADVAVEGETIAAVGRRPAARRRRGDRRLRRARDAGLHRRPHAPRHAVRRHDDRRRLGHRARAAALAGGTTTIVDFSLQDVDGTLDGGGRDVAGQGGVRPGSTSACTSRSRT